MSSDTSWEKKKLKDLCLKIGSGATPSGGKENYKTSGISLIRSQNIYNHTFLYNGLAYIDDEQAKKLNNVDVQRDDVLLNITGDSVCRCCIVPNEILPARVNQHVAIIRADQLKLNPFFLKSYLTNELMQNFMLSLAQTGGTRAALTKGMIEDFEILVPDLREQNRISKTLCSLDKKIELNNAMNKNIEEMAQALFKRWFVDFEFPNENGEPYKTSGGDFKESIFGSIPNEWQVLELSDLVSVKDGTHDSPKKSPTGYPLVTTRNLKDNIIDFSDANIISEEDYNKINLRSKVDRFDILISMIGTVGNLYLVQEEKIDFAIKNLGLFKTSESENMYEYIYLYLKSDVIRNYINERLAGSTQQYISLGELRKIPLLFPSISILEEFKGIVSGILTTIHNRVTENQRLAKIRDTLLPKLMSGEIRVPMEQEYTQSVDLPMVAESSEKYSVH